MTQPPAIRIENLTKDFKIGILGVKLRAVDNISLEVADRQIYGLLGPNGSGKSTTMKLILGLLEPTKGRCEVFGKPSTSLEARAQIGFLPEAPYFYRYLTGKELVLFYAKICGVPSKEREARTHEVLSLVDMQFAADRRVGTYSKGMLQRIGLAQALVHDPRLIILDEPTAGVDPIGSAAIAEIILRLRERGKTILLCSHLLAQVEGICDRVAIMNKGHMEVEGQVSQLLEREDRQHLVVTRCSPAALEAAKAALAAHNSTLLAIETPRIGLDKLFLEKVAGEDRGDNRVKE